MNFILDTSAYSAMQRGDTAIARLLAEASQVYVPTVVIAELKAGFAFGPRQQQNNRYLQKFLADPAVSIINISENTTDIFAEMYAELRKSGKTIGQNDLWIAALCREAQFPLLTLDSDFSCIDGLELISR